VGERALSGTNAGFRVLTHKGLRIAGFEGSAWYGGRGVEYSEREMRWRTWSMLPKVYLKGGVDLVISHTPPALTLEKVLPVETVVPGRRGGGAAEAAFVRVPNSAPPTTPIAGSPATSSSSTYSPLSFGCTVTRTSTTAAYTGYGSIRNTYRQRLRVRGGRPVARRPVPRGDLPFDDPTGTGPPSSFLRQDRLLPFPHCCGRGER
jgi:hypothetical protein